MLFTSFSFFVFFTIVYALYLILPFRAQTAMLLAASYVFYGWWSTQFLFLIVFSTAVDFFCGAMIDSGRLSKKNLFWTVFSVPLAALVFDTLRWDAFKIDPDTMRFSIHWSQVWPDSWRAWMPICVAGLFSTLVSLGWRRAASLEVRTRRVLFLWISIATNLALLGFFKYFNFFAENAAAVLSSVGFNADLFNLNIILPVGISFYTFKAISYACDIYRGKLRACDDFLTFALFWAYFPPLFAGPIDRASDLLPQLSSPRRTTFKQMSEGLFLILFGIFKKASIADGLAGAVNSVYATTGSVGWTDIVVATILYAIQIYCDFCGYSDIARGLSKMMGIELMVNFNLPYFSKHPSEFWQRWHISLSSWLRDYLYIPLGGNRGGLLRTNGNLVATMVLGGLWHGAAWNFILWGLYHGILLCGYRPLRLTETGSYSSVASFGFLRRLALTAIFLSFTCYGWLLFRSTSLNQISQFTHTLLFGFDHWALTLIRPPIYALLGIAVLTIYETLAYRSGDPFFFFSFPRPLRSAFYAALIVIILMGQSHATAQFIYSQF